MGIDVLRGNRGFADVYWAWRTPIKILFVIDGRVRLDKDRNDFGLGYVLDTLNDASAWWVQFVVHVAKHKGCLGAEAQGDYELTYPNFKFTNFGFDLDDYDQVWFFADEPSKDDGADGVTTDADIASFALEPAEVKIVAEWMDRGGGVFAAGDHSILGASLCSKIPRVRTMRKWTHAQGVPSKSSAERHETIQKVPPNVDESDTLLQPLELVLVRADGPFPFPRPFAPHPLMTSSLGAIDRFPDHMHEGEVIADALVRLDEPLDIPGYSRPEYPFPPVVGSPNVAAAFARPRPHVVAYGRTTNPNPVVALPALAPGSGNSGFSTSDVFTKRFGLVGAYDGDSVGIGRVVVDSTWHHWFSYNLVAIAAQGSTPYAKMQAYYRNVGLWLTTPAQRQGMLIAATWRVLTGSPPMEFSPNDDPWRVGERVSETLCAASSAEMLGEWVAAFLSPGAPAAMSPSRPPSEFEPSWGGAPRELVTRAIVGGIGSALLGLAFDQRNKRARGERPRLDVEAIRRGAIDGAARGHALLKKSIHHAAAAFAAIDSDLAALEPRPFDVRIPVKVSRLRVVAEALDVPDSNDPAILRGPATVTLRLRRDDDPVPPTPQCLATVELPSFLVHGGLNELGFVVGEVEVQTGESLSVEVLVGRHGARAAPAEAVRFNDTLVGDAAGWIAGHAPARSQPWRLWYRIEEADSAYSRS
jgi:hypothetical protein